ncbi:hypothetical protein AAKU67_001077 [Oxalobacteraceae bacterium GrIS 2.11]
MKIGRLQTAGLLLATTLILAGCGGGVAEVGVSGTVTVPVVVVPAGPVFDIVAYVNGYQVAGFDALPGDVQTLSIPVNQSFELNSDSSVTWNVFVNGVEVPDVNNAIIVGDVTINETSTTNLLFAGDATSPSYLPAPVQVTLIATSLIDGSQTARINFVITN